MAQDYDVTAKLHPPKFERVSKYLLLEHEFIAKKLASNQRWWELVSIPSLGIFRHIDWKDYRQRLKKYELEMERYANEVYDGLLPLYFIVWHNGSEVDRHIRVELKVHDGEFRVAKTSPKPPVRIDGGVDRQNIPHMPKLTGFSRSAITIHPHEVSAVFSRLDAHGNARLIHDVLYLHTTPRTRVDFIINSDRADSVKGEVRIV